MARISPSREVAILRRLIASAEEAGAECDNLNDYVITTVMIAAYHDRLLALRRSVGDCDRDRLQEIRDNIKNIWRW